MCGTLRQEASVPSVGLRGLSRPTGRQFEEREVDKIRVSDFVLVWELGKQLRIRTRDIPPYPLGVLVGAFVECLPFIFVITFFFFSTKYLFIGTIMWHHVKVNSTHYSHVFIYFL